MGLETTKDCRQRHDTGDTQCKTKTCDENVCVLCIPDGYPGCTLIGVRGGPNEPECKECDGFTEYEFTDYVCEWDPNYGWECRAMTFVKWIPKGKVKAYDPDWAKKILEKYKN